MKDLLQQADEIPITLVVALAYVTMAFLTNPASPTPEQLHQHGWLMATLVSDGEPWRLLTCAFLHGGWLHLAFNTYALLRVGPALERSLGSVRMAALYLVSALGGSLAVCLVSGPFQPVVGGSGALFGMFGAIVAIQMRQSRSTLGFLNYEGPRRVLSLILINLLIGAIVPFISNTAHVGGLIIGFAFTFLFLTGTNKTDKLFPAWRVALLALTVSLTLHTLQPSTRWDWLWRQARVTEDQERREQLQFAATRSFQGKTDVKRYDIQFLEAQMDSYDRELKRLSTK